MEEKWAKVLRFVRETGDKAIVFEGEDVFVVGLLEKTLERNQGIKEKANIVKPEKLLEKINQEIAVWQRLEKEKEIEAEISEDIANFSQDNSDDSYYIEPVE